MSTFAGELVHGSAAHFWDTDIDVRPPVQNDGVELTFRSEADALAHIDAMGRGTVDYAVIRHGEGDDAYFTINAIEGDFTPSDNFTRITTNSLDSSADPAVSVVFRDGAHSRAIPGRPGRGDLSPRPGLRRGDPRLSGPPSRHAARGSGQRPRPGIALRHAPRALRQAGPLALGGVRLPGRLPLFRWPVVVAGVLVVDQMVVMLGGEFAIGHPVTQNGISALLGPSHHVGRIALVQVVDVLVPIVGDAAMLVDRRDDLPEDGHRDEDADDDGRIHPEDQPADRDPTGLLDAAHLSAATLYSSPAGGRVKVNAAEHQGRELIAEALPGPGGEHRERGAAGEERLDDAFLARSEGAEAEPGLEHLPGRRCLRCSR